MEWFLVWTGCGLLTAALAWWQGHSPLRWLAAGLLLGPVALLLSGLMERRGASLILRRWLNGEDVRPCPRCGEALNADAARCPHCGAVIQ